MLSRAGRRAAKARTTITPLQGGWARIEGSSGKAYGQTITWYVPLPVAAQFAGRLFLVEPPGLAPEKKENVTNSRVDLRIK